MPRPRILLLLIVGCIRTTPQPTAEGLPQKQAIRVPAGCLESMAGDWVHASDPTYRYRAEDDGGTVTLFVTHVAQVDAGFSPRRFRLDDAGVSDAGAPDAGPPDAGPEPALVRVELQRTEHGFVGQTLAPLTHPAGRVCEGRFPTTVIDCAAGLVLETQSATALGDACQAPARPLEQPTQRHQLVRPDAG